jgi:hypothetical protein
VEIHKPKPIHGWRDFLSEMTVIVLGILIALGGEQLIERLHWHSEVSATELRLSRELGGNVSVAAARVRTLPCIEKRLDEIATVVDEAAKSGKLPPVASVGNPAFFLWGHGTWDTAVASQTTDHFPGQRLANFSRAYQFITRLEAINQQELEDWAELSSIVGPGRAFDSSAAQAARLALSHARFRGREMALASQGLMQRVKALELPFEKATRAQIEANIHAPLSRFSICEPMTTQISTRYGQSALDDVPPALEKALSDPQHLYD